MSASNSRSIFIGLAVNAMMSSSSDSVCSLEEEEETSVDCFAWFKERFWRRHNNENLESITNSNNGFIGIFPDDILEMCLVVLPPASLANARLVCKKWNSLTSTPRFLQMRREGGYQNPWLFVFGSVRVNSHFGENEIHALDVSRNKWHRIDDEFLKGWSEYSVASIQEHGIFIVGGCYGKRKAHKEVMFFSPMRKSWCKMPSMKYARQLPLLGVCEDPPPHHHDHQKHSNESEAYSCFHNRNSNIGKGVKRFLLIAIGGIAVHSGEIYDSLSNKWTEIQRLPLDFGTACCGIVCDRMFYVCSWRTEKLAAYDLERGFWIAIQTSSPFPPNILKYGHQEFVSSNGRLFMLSNSLSEDQKIYVRRLWELDLMYLTWTQVSVHSDAHKDNNAVFVADRNMIFGVETSKILDLSESDKLWDLIIVCDVSKSSDDMANWSHISRKLVPRVCELDPSFWRPKAMAMLHL